MNFGSDTKKKNIILIFFFIIFLFHILCVNFYPINDEFIFPIGSKLIEKYSVEDVNLFFNYNANTLGFSFVIFILTKITNLDHDLIAKLLSTSGLIFILIGVYNILDVIKFKIRNDDLLYLIIIIFLNPLIFNFSLRGTPDFFGSAISFFAISIFLSPKKVFFKYLAIIIFGIGVIVKPTNAILILLNYLNIKKISIKNLIHYSYLKNFLLLLFFPIIYFLINFNYFGFFVVPTNFNYLGDSSFSKYLINFITYSGFLGLMTCPLYLIYLKDLNIKKIFKILIYTFISILIALFFMKKSGELNFGPLSNYLGEKVFFFIITMSFFLIFDLIISNKEKINNNQKIMLFLFLLYIIVLSKYHTSQRYFLTIIPLYLIVFYKIFFNKFLYFVTLILYVSLNILLFSNHYQTQLHVKNLINFLKNEKIIFDTQPGYLGQHALNFFVQLDKNGNNYFGNDDTFNKNKKYYVSQKKPKINQKIIFVSKSKNILLNTEEIYIIEKIK
tara:strand:- start:14099 stop:15598 length:1500 start_codon:yes stop_codon:yes gene_type:complete